MIPKKIHFFWIGGNPKPESVLYCIESWKRFCPDYVINEWNETNYDLTKNKYMQQAYEAKKWGFVPDYARLDVIYQYGGIYLDTDVELIHSLNELLHNRAFFGFEKTTEKDHYVACGLGFGAEAGTALIREMMNEYNDLSFLDQNGKPNLLTSPKINTRTLKRYGLLNEDKDQMILDARIYASDVLCPQMFCSSVTHLTDRTVSIHHYDASWLEGDRKRLYERNIRLNKLMGDRLGNRIAKTMEDGEYLVKAGGRRIKSYLKRN